MVFDARTDLDSPVDYDGRTANGGVVARWGGIGAGLFIVAATMVLFAEIGMAIGLSAFEPGDRAAAYALGAGVWGFVAAIVAFFVGGFGATRFSHLVRPRSGLAQGALVWAVSVPVLGFLAAILAIGATTAGAATAGAATAAAAVAGENITPVPAEPAAREGVRDAAREATRPDNVERATKTAGAVGWAMVAALLLSLGAAAAGGAMGTRYAARDRITTTHVTRREAVTHRGSVAVTPSGDADYRA